MRFRILVSDRKEVKAKLEELTGERPVYTKMPRCAFILRGIALEKNGEVTTEEDADAELIEKLIEAGMISEAVEETGMESSGITDPEETGRTDHSEEQDAELEEHTTEPDTDREEPAAETEDHNTQAVKPTVSFPLDKHRPESIINLVNTMFSKGRLISKSTGGSFSAASELVEELRNGRFIRTENVVSMINEEGGLTGLSFEDGKVIFDGFPETADPEEVRAWSAFAATVNKACIRQKHVRASRSDETNEKFAFRTWLTRLGMDGPDLKEERAILYKNLSGHTAFRTEADAQKWARRQQEKRDELRRRKEDALRQEERAEGTGE